MNILSRLHTRLQKSLARVPVGNAMPDEAPVAGRDNRQAQALSIDEVIERVVRTHPVLTAPFLAETPEGVEVPRNGHQILEALRLKSAALEVLLASLRQEIPESGGQENLDAFLRHFRIGNDTTPDRFRMAPYAALHYLQAHTLGRWEPLKKVLKGFHEAVHEMVKAGLALPEGAPGRDAFVAGFSTHMAYRKTIGIARVTSDCVFGWVGQAKTPDVVAVLATFPAPLTGFGLQDRGWVDAFSRDPVRVHALWEQGARTGFSKDLVRLVRTPALMVHFLEHVGPLPVSVVDWVEGLGEIGVADIAEMVKSAQDAGHDVFAGDFSWAEEILKSLTDREAEVAAAVAAAISHKAWYDRVAKNVSSGSALEAPMKIKKAIERQREEIIEATHANWHTRRERLVTLLALSGRLDEPDAKGSTLLHRFVFRGHGEAVRALLDAGADPTVRNAEGLDAQALLALAKLIRRTPIDDLGSEESLEALTPLVDSAHLDQSLAPALKSTGPKRL
jgi:hypothetical protein